MTLAKLLKQSYNKSSHKSIQSTLGENLYLEGNNNLSNELSNIATQRIKCYFDNPDRMNNKELPSLGPKSIIRVHDVNLYYII